MIAVLLTPFTLIPEAARNRGELWQQTYQRRYFLMGGVARGLFRHDAGPLRRHDQPRHLQSANRLDHGRVAEQRLAEIHVLTIVSSYGAGGLAWGLGNLAMLYYLFGKYRSPGQTSSVALAATGAGPTHNGGPIFDLDAHYRGGEPSLAARLKKAGEAPSRPC